MKELTNLHDVIANSAQCLNGAIIAAIWSAAVVITVVCLVREYAGARRISSWKVDR